MAVPTEASLFVDVLIIGAGPAGLMAANALAKNGVDVRIIDQRPVKVAAGQADGIQPRTIEVLQSYGLADRLLREGNQMHLALTTRVPDVTAPSARFPFEVTLHQGAIEALFLDSLSGFNVQVDRPIVPTSIEVSGDPSILKDPNDYAVKIRLKHLESGKIEIVQAKYVIGCDGAHSWVRKQLGIVMEGEQTDDIWGVVDLTPVTDFPDIRNRTLIHSDTGSCMIIPREGDVVRLYIQLREAEVVNPLTGRVDKEKTGPSQLLDVARRIFRPYKLEVLDVFHWWTVYITGQRVASQFSIHNRVFIAGDACHTHSPKAGQGMNASMNDSHNLAWKLAHVLRGWARTDLLSTYQLERRTYAQNLINFDKKFAKFFTGKARSDSDHDGVSHEEFLQIFQTFGGFTSGIGIHYDPSSIVDVAGQTLAANLVIGQRMLPHIFLRAADGRPFELQDLLPADARFKIVVFTGDTSNKDQLKTLHAAAESLNNALTAFVPASNTNGGLSTVFDIIAISSATKFTVRYTDFPLIFRPHWSKPLIDDVDAPGRQGGGGYSKYGIGEAGAIVVVRPDGYVGAVFALTNASAVSSYFEKFMNKA